MLHDEIKLILCLDDLIKLDDPGVPDLLQDPYLPRYAVDVHLILDFRFLQNLDGHLFLGDSLNAELDFSKSAFTQLFVNEEVGYLFSLFLAGVAA